MLYNAATGRSIYLDSAFDLLRRRDVLPDINKNPPVNRRIYSGLATLKDDDAKRPLRVTVLEIFGQPIAYHCDRGFIRAVIGDTSPIEAIRYINAIYSALDLPRRLRGLAAKSSAQERAKPKLVFGSIDRRAPGKPIAADTVITIKTPADPLPALRLVD